MNIIEKTRILELGQVGLRSESKELIRNNRLDKVFQLVFQWISIDSPNYNVFVTLESEYNAIVELEIMGIDVTQRKAVFKANLLKAIDRLTDKDLKEMKSESSIPQSYSIVVDGNNNIVIQGVDGSTIQIFANLTEIEKYVQIED